MLLHIIIKILIFIALFEDSGYHLNLLRNSICCSKYKKLYLKVSLKHSRQYPYLMYSNGLIGIENQSTNLGKYWWNPFFALNLPQLCVGVADIKNIISRQIDMKQEYVLYIFSLMLSIFNYCVIIHYLEVSCKEDQITRARSASDLYSYNRPANSELLHNNSRTRADLFRFELTINDENRFEVFSFFQLSTIALKKSRQTSDCFANVYMRF